MLKTLKVFSDGAYTVTTPAPVKDMHFAIVKMLPNPNQTFPNEVMAAAVNDQDVPIRLMKGDKIPCRQWFDIMSQIQTPAALRWATNPHLLWINDRYKGDIDYPDVDPQGNQPSDAEPIAECIAYPCNFISYNFRQGNWFNLVAYDSKSPPTNPYSDNWTTLPYLWHKAQARNIVDSHLSNPGAGLDVYLPILRQYNYVWMNLSQLELFPELPFVLDNGTTIISYQLQGANVIGVTESGAYLFLRKVGKFTGMSEPFGWHLQTPPVIPPEGF